MRSGRRPGMGRRIKDLQKYSPDQLRVAAGQSGGGQWTSTNSSDAHDAVSENDFIELILDPGGRGNGGGEGLNGCVVALAACTVYAERLFDLGYERESFELRQACYKTTIGCNAFDASVQSLGPPYFGLTTYPPNPMQGGGGVVYHQFGSQPVYAPPAKDPLANIPPAR